MVVEGFCNFTGISGCAENVVDNTCFPEYWETFNVLSGILSGNGTFACVDEFREMFENGWTASLTAARAFFHACFDANPMFTGLGYGYSSTASQLTEREYLARNTRLDQLGASDCLLYSPYTVGAHNFNMPFVTLLPEN